MLTEVGGTVLPSTSVYPYTDDWYSVPPLVRYYPFPDGSYAVGDAAHCINTDPFTRSLLCQPEQCPDSGKLHVQFYVEFQSPKALSVAKAI